MRNVINTLNEISEITFISLLFLIGFLIGCLAINTRGPYYISPDGTGYHNYAVNIALRGVYSPAYKYPYTVNFTREPGYPMFLAAVYKIYDIFGEPTLLNWDEYNVTTKTMKTKKGEIQCAKYVQLILLIISVYFIYKILINLHSIGKARFISLLIILYYPFTSYCTYILRESLVTFLLALFAFCMVKFYLSKKQLYLLLATITIALAAFTWQVMVVFAPLILIIMLLSKIRFWQSIKYIILYAIIFISLLFPWFAYVYSYYPNLKIVTSMGTSLTPEVINWTNALLEAEYFGEISNEELYQIYGRGRTELPEAEIFQRSFSGWYSASADSITRKLNLSFKQQLQYKGYKAFKNLKGLFLQNNWTPFVEKFRESISFITKGYSKTENKYDIIITIQTLVLNILSILIGVFSILGFIVYNKRNLIYWIPYLFYCALFYTIGSESRRFIPVLPWILYLSYYFIFYAYKKLSMHKHNAIKDNRIQLISS